MIYLFTGGPGAGKTASMVDFLSKLPGDRPIYVHYDPARKIRPDDVPLHESLTLSHHPVHADKWHTDLPDGSILVIDEVQDVWRNRSAGSKVPEAVMQLETHRHRGIDVFVTTQSPKLMDANVRALVGRHVHIRDVGVLGRYAYEWPECNEGLAWKTCTNKKRISLPKKAFSLYKSASLHTVPVRGFPRALIVGVAALVAFAVLGYGVYNIIQRTQAKPAPVVAPAAVPGSPSYAPAVPVQAVYDAAAFIPRISNKPESAPAYDHLRKVVAMPQVVGGYCIGDDCKCITNQGSDSGLSSSECKRWVSNPPFDPYRAKVVTAAYQASPPPGQQMNSGSPGGE